MDKRQFEDAMVRGPDGKLRKMTAADMQEILHARVRRNQALREQESAAFEGEGAAGQPRSVPGREPMEGTEEEMWTERSDGFGGVIRRLVTIFRPPQNFPPGEKP